MQDCTFSEAFKIVEEAFGPYIILPSQTHGMKSESEYDKLFCAVLEDAFFVIQRHRKSKSKANQELLNETVDWLMNDGHGLFASNNICEMLHLNIDAVRDRAKKLLSGKAKLSMGRRSPVMRDRKKR